MAAIVNLTGKKVYVYARERDGSLACKSVYLDGNNPASVDFVMDCVVIPLLGQDISCKRYGKINGLPKPMSGIYLIVMPDVAEAARLQGRDVSDLLIPDGLFNFKDGIIDCMYLVQPQ